MKNLLQRVAIALLFLTPAVGLASTFETTNFCRCPNCHCPDCDDCPCR